MFSTEAQPAPAEQLTITVDIPADNMQALLATLQAVQLASDAALLTTEYLVRGYDEDDYLRRVAMHGLYEGIGPVKLEIVSIERGSWRLKFSLNPGTDNGRRWIAAIGILVGTGLAVLGVVLAGPVGAAGAVTIGGAILQAVTALPAILVSSEPPAPTVVVNTVDQSALQPGTRVDIDVPQAA